MASSNQTGAPPRRGSLQALKDMMGSGGSRSVHYDTKKKDSLSNWQQFTTVSWRADNQKDFDEHTSVVMEKDSFWIKANHEMQSWYIPCIVGFMTATSGAFIEKCVEQYGAWRFGYCSTSFLGTPENCKGAFITYGDGPWDSDQSTNGFMAFIAFSTLLAAVSATLTWAFAPMSRGSGIPEIKTILGGFTFPEVLAANTLIIKIFGLAMSVGAGLSCGKEGPLVHISCAWCHNIAKFYARYRNNEAKQRELLSGACASGVAVAFGAPLGGVLFSLEEASTIFPMRTMLRAFLGASVAAVALWWWNPTGTGKLTMFNTDYQRPPHFVEYPIFAVMGVLGGVIGAGFVHWNIQIMKARAPGTWFRKKCHIVLEVALISFFTAITSYRFYYTRILSNTAIRGFFQDCTSITPDGPSPHSYYLDLCENTGGDNWMPRVGMDLMWELCICAILRYVQMCFTFGTGAAAGLFIPSLYVGAALGRILGVFVHLLNLKFQFTPQVFPGMYSMLGAAAVLGGVCRVTISLVVIMFELTGGLQLICPFMVVCMLAKWVGDYYTIGIYDYIIIVRKYPFLHEPDEVTYHHSAADVMDEAVETLHPDGTTVGGFIEFLQKAKYGGYPLTQSESDPTLLGYIHTNQLLQYLERKKREDVFINADMPVYFKKYMEQGKDEAKKGALDISKYVDECVVTVVKKTPAVQLQQIFRNLGVKIILVRDQGRLAGMITKKSFIVHMEKLHHRDHDPKKKGKEEDKGNLQQGLLPK